MQFQMFEHPRHQFQPCRRKALIHLAIHIVGPHPGLNQFRRGMVNPAIRVAVLEPAGIRRNRDKNRLRNRRRNRPADRLEEIIDNFPRRRRRRINQLHSPQTITGYMMVYDQYCLAALFNPFFKTWKLHKTIRIDYHNQVNITIVIVEFLFFNVIIQDRHPRLKHRLIPACQRRQKQSLNLFANRGEALHHRPYTAAGIAVRPDMRRNQHAFGCHQAGQRSFILFFLNRHKYIQINRL